MTRFNSKDTRSFKDIMARMTWPERLEYLWTYYKWVLVAAVFAVILLCAAASILRAKTTETLFSISVVNVEFS